jgi:hypothetical protein
MSAYVNFPSPNNQSGQSDHDDLSYFERETVVLSREYPKLFCLELLSSAQFNQPDGFVARYGESPLVANYAFL